MCSAMRVLCVDGVAIGAAEVTAGQSYKCAETSLHCSVYLSVDRTEDAMYSQSLVTSQIEFSVSFRVIFSRARATSL